MRSFSGDGRFGGSTYHPPAAGKWKSTPGRSTWNVGGCSTVPGRKPGLRTRERRSTWNVAPDRRRNRPARSRRDRSTGTTVAHGRRRLNRLRGRARAESALVWSSKGSDHDPPARSQDRNPRLSTRCHRRPEPRCASLRAIELGPPEKRCSIGRSRSRGSLRADCLAASEPHPQAHDLPGTWLA